MENNQTEQKQPIVVTLQLTVSQVNAILLGLGELKTNSGVWPLTQNILQQVQPQLPVEETTETEQTVQ